jgi:hypothetical protein
MASTVFGSPPERGAPEFGTDHLHGPGEGHNRHRTGRKAFRINAVKGSYLPSHSSFTSL